MIGRRQSVELRKLGKGLKQQEQTNLAKPLAENNHEHDRLPSTSHGLMTGTVLGPKKTRQRIKKARVARLGEQTSLAQLTAGNTHESYGASMGPKNDHISGTIHILNSFSNF